MHKFIVANYKMNGDKAFYKAVAKKINSLRIKDTKIVLCPPFVYLPNFKIRNKNAVVGSQDISMFQSGKSTGQISPNMLKEFNVNFSIIGHSERRANGETDEQISLKVKTSTEAEITPIICVGELKKNSKLESIVEQVECAIKNCKKCASIIFAYEPVWAIGSGEVPTINKINKVVKLIKETIKKYEIEPICLYGGSVNEKNYLELTKCDIDGFLLGGVTLNLDKFIEIVRGIDNE